MLLVLDREAPVAGVEWEGKSSRSKSREAVGPRSGRHSEPGEDLWSAFYSE